MQIGLNQLNHASRYPLSWLDEMLNAVEHANFFENCAFRSIVITDSVPS
jgi:ribonucleoside-diphosphate reductase beta chain